MNNQSDKEFESVLEGLVEAMGSQVRRLLAERQLRGGEISPFQASAERQAEVMSLLEQEMVKLRPMRDRLLLGLRGENR